MGILDDSPLEGTYGIERVLYPAPLGHIVDETDYSAAIKQVQENCHTWGGAFNVMAPAARGGSEPDPCWTELLRSSRLHAVAGNGVIQPPGEPTALSRDVFGTMFLDDVRNDPTLLTVLAWSNKSTRDERRPVLDASRVAVDNPWHLAYLGIWGSLPTTFDTFELEVGRLAPDATYESVLRFSDDPFEPDADHLLKSLRSAEMPAARYSSCFLSYTSGSLGSQFNSTPTLPIRGYTAADFGPNVIVVYEPGNVSDLCLLWQLRAVSGLASGFPLAIPASEDVSSIALRWVRDYAPHLWGMRDLKCAFVSTSVPLQELEQLAEATPHFHAINWWEVVRPAPGCGIWSSAVANFSNGVAKLPSITEVDESTLTRSVLEQIGFRLSLRVSVHGKRLPRSNTMNTESYFGPRYNDGAIVQASTRRDFVDVRYPTGIDVMHAVVMDRGLTCRLSTPGRIASQLVAQIGSVDELTWLCSPLVTKLIDELTTRRGQSYIKRRLAAFLQEPDNGSIESSARAELVLDRINRALGGPEDDEDRSDVAYSVIQRHLGSRDAALAWLDWAERRRLLLRGTLIECPECSYKGWRPMSDIAPPVICRGCTKEIEKPYKNESLNYRYRAGEVLVRAHSADVLSHLFAQRYFDHLYSSGDGDSFIYGSYPGVEFLDDAGSVIGEADVLLVTMDGGLVVGECKTRAGGLTEDELAKLWRVCDALDASASFVATLDSSAKCNEIWRTRSVTGRPHFALTAEHLYEFTPVNAVGDKPLEWREHYRPYGAKSREANEAEIVEEFAKHLGNMSSWQDTFRLPGWRLPKRD
ncbi:hypothetical protein [Pseudonocardia sp. WMMC193]|uniref:hypothetical protein n=1 Tax=Pseudonocardia sp. WMMC193 TaxID=2911965 RepID=UPI001F1D4443|nr:hypothetical protein [Pseudonocardia sp. WMMC193]MCF7552258.1 hypothetical protein [Pseudonocardia sp. WMMC193]